MKFMNNIWAQNKMTKVYSVNGERFFQSKTTVFDILHWNNRFVIGEPYYEASSKQLTSADIVSDVDFVTEHFDNILYDFVDESRDCYMAHDVDDAAKSELRQLLIAWVDKHIDLSTDKHSLGESVQVHVTSDDIKNYTK